MTKTFIDLMQDARSLVASRRLREATTVLQDALGGRKPGRDPAPHDGPTLDLEVEGRAAPASGPDRPSASLADKLAPYLAMRPRFQMPAADRPTRAPAMPDGALFEMQAFQGPAGGRRYRLYVPAALPAGPRPLVMMLHGCTQDPDDFARGTRMNALAEEMGFLVAYPEQPPSANARLCWNWFEPGHQARGAGEPAILAGIVAEIARTRPIDERSIFVAGLSAGGAMAAVMGATYPDLFAAVGVHSGLPFGAAKDVSSALSIMRSGRGGGAGPATRDPTPRMIVFHGEKDRTVHPANGETLAGPVLPGETTERGTIGGRAYARRVRPSAGGAPAAEYWSIEGLGHAWSGGDAGGTYADPDGPDASREMMRFFLAGAKPL